MRFSKGQCSPEVVEVSLKYTKRSIQDQNQVRVFSGSLRSRFKQCGPKSRAARIGLCNQDGMGQAKWK
jgi:hypothetical protein